MKILSCTAIGLFLCLAFLPVAGQITANLDGKRDPSFAAISRPGPSGSYFSDLKILSDGSIVGLHNQTGNVGWKFAISKTLPNGTVDENFGDSGYRVYQFPSSVYGTRLVLQPDGKFLVVGTIDSPSNQQNKDFFVLRVLPNGNVDTTFGIGGVVVKDFTPVNSNIISSDVAGSIVSLPDGRLVVAGAANQWVSGQSKTSAYIVLLGLEQNGDIDAAFGDNGISMILSGNNQVNLDDLKPAEVIRLANGKILVGENVRRPRPASPNEYVSRAVIRRYLQNGTLDTTFAGMEGKDVSSDLSMKYPSRFVNFSELSSGKALILTTDGLLRLNTDGGFDITFGNDGRQQLLDRNCQPMDLALINGDRIAVSRYCNRSLQPGIRFFGIIEKRWPDGSLDIHFARQGEFTMDLGNVDVIAGRMGAFQDKYLFFSGTTQNPGPLPQPFAIKLFGRRKPW